MCARWTQRTIAIILVALAIRPVVRADEQPAARFNRDVRPVLSEFCFSCHGPNQQRREADLRLDTREAALADRGGYAAVVPCQPEKSELVARINDPDPARRMPPADTHKFLSDAQRALLKRWIAAGAEYESHWTFQPIRRPGVPAVKFAAAESRNPIDAFVQARLEAEQVEPAPQADRRTLIRRVYLDLIGLPPTPAQFAEFLADPSADAYEKVVDGLLASPHYGERWARPWLDLCHYGDSDGYLQDFPRPYAWRYRDWLVAALNRDLPFDQFTIAQLAGDLLPNATTDQKIATGFLRQTLSNREGGADLEEFRVEQVVDRVQMIGTAWLGLTIGCARCHDHKYDPVSQRDFYRLYAALDGADEVNIDAPLPGEAEPYQAQRAAYDRQRRELLQPWAAAAAELQARWETKLRAAAGQPGRDQAWDREWEVLGLVWGQSLGEGQLEGTQIVRLDPQQRTPEQQEKLQDYFLANGQIIDPDSQFSAFKPRELAARLTALRAALPKLSRAQTVRETQVPRAVHVHARGDFRQPGERVDGGLPAALLHTKVSPGEPPAIGRLELARWLVSRDHPLTARVVVNRAWQEFFGSGLVATSEDFGVRGEPPSHPDLLDWLAAELMERGWSVKQLHRLIVTSATYRQSSHFRPELAARDPHNRLLARQSSLRLSAEQIRDSALAVSGLFDAKVGGPSVRPPQPDNVAMEAFDNRWAAGETSERYRRGLYTFVQRTSPFAQNVTFDAPPSSRSCTRRERSNTPLQALTLLNDPVFFEAAQAFAGRILREVDGGAEQQIEHAYLLALGRPPSPVECERLVTLLDRERTNFARHPELIEQIAPGVLAGSDRIEAAVRVCLCSVLLNLHEFITRD